MLGKKRTVEAEGELDPVTAPVGDYAFTTDNVWSVCRCRYGRIRNGCHQPSPFCWFDTRANTKGL